MNIIKKSKINKQLENIIGQLQRTSDLILLDFKLFMHNKYNLLI